LTASPNTDVSAAIDAKSSNWQRWIAPALGVLLAGMVLYLVLTVVSGLDRLHAALSIFPLVYIPAILCLIIAGWLLRALRWHYYARTLGWPVPFTANTLAFLASFAFTATPGKAGEVVKAALLRSRYQVSLADTAGVLLVERMGDVMAVLLLGMGGVALLPNGWVVFIAGLVCMAGLVILLANEGLYRPLILRIGEQPKLHRLAAKLLQLLTTGRALLRPKPLCIGLVIALIAWGFEAFAFGVILSGLGISVSWVGAFSVYALSTVVGALSMLPGGIGGVEATMLVFLAVLRAESGAAVAAVLLIRLCTLYFVSLLGVAFMGIWWLTTNRRRVS